MNDNSNFSFNSANFILFLYKWRKPLMLIAVIAIICSVIFSSPWFITPKFKSTVIMFPTSTNAVSKALLSESFGNKQDILEFGEEEQAEQLLQILNSNQIRAKVIKKYSLMKHYGIDSNERFCNTKIYREYDRNITFKRTEFMAVQITVLDKDPQMAADIANNISELMDSVKNQMIKERAMMAYRIVEKEYSDLVAQVKMMEDSMTTIRKLGVHEYETQSEMLMQQLAIEYAKGNTRGIKALEEKLGVLAQYGGAYVSLREALLHEKKQLSLVKAKFAEAKVDAEQVLPQKFIVNSAFKAEKKTYPVRWLIVMVTTLSSLLLCILVIIIVESIKKSELEPVTLLKKKKADDKE